MKKLLLLLSAIFLISTFVYSQDAEMSTDNGQTISTCNGTITLGTYTGGQSFVTTICSDDPLNQHIFAFLGSGYSFPAGTELCIYDGTTTSSPLLVCYNSTTSGEVGAGAQNTNTSGCLTFEFTSSVGGASFSGALSCQFACPSPILVDVISSDPPLVDDGGVDYINVCWDEDNNQSETITFTAAGSYPPVTGYTLDDANVTFTWEFNDGSPNESGLGLTTVTHEFPAREGYTVIVTIEDSQGCINTNAVAQRVRVSRAPIWNTTTTNLSTDAICMGEPVTMCGNYSSATWNSSIIPAVADTVSLPDGSGVCYESQLTQNQFLPGQTLGSINDLNAICMNLEHSYLGDLTIDIQCPSGQSITLEEQGGGGTFLGVPIDNGGIDNNAVPGEGYWYCITPDATQTMAAAAGSVSTLPAGDYASAESLAGLVGCDLNGLWTITICDWWGSDDGYIFGWYIDFDPSLFPEIWSYTPSYTPTEWGGLYGSEIDDPTDQNCAEGTYLTTATPDVNSDQPFIFTITDDFGCIHDTAMYVTVYHQNDPNCCIQPNPNAGSDDEICSLTYNLNASAITAGNNGYWEMVSGLGTAAFVSGTSSTTDVNVTLYGAYTFQWTEEYLGNPGCANNATVTIIFNETFDPTLSAIPDMCISEAPVQIFAVDFGTLACTTVPAAIVNGFFDPELAGPGVHTITNTVDDPCSGGPLVSSINVEVFDEINVINFSETCNTLAEGTFTVAWDVVGYDDSPYSGFLVDGVPQGGSSFTEDIISPDSYNYLVTDPNGCSDFPINGFRDCGCPLFAGTMGSLQTVVLCQDECSAPVVDPSVTHNGDEETDGGSGIFEFMIHTGNNIPIAYSSTPNFCLGDFASSFNTIYYISAICGQPLGGHADISGGCYSISQGTPVMWQQNPIAHAGSNRDTCGLVIQLDGNTPEAGMYGYWSSTCEFFAIGGTSYTTPNALVMAAGYNTCTMNWNIVNGECVATDEVIIGFLETPNPFAGDDITICGNEATMDGAPSLITSDLSWSGSGTTFNPQSAVDAIAQVSTYGTYQYTITEDNGSCTGTDEVLVTYIQGPSPSTTPNVDSVCGVEYDLIVYNVTGVGQWTAYEGGLPASPAPLYSPSINDPIVTVTIGNYDGLTREIEFVWEETNQVQGVECTGGANKVVVFAKQPIASVGAIDESEICGNCNQFDADVTGSEWALGTWIAKDVIGSFDDETLADATFCVNPEGAFGDTAHVRTPFIWVMTNPEFRGCVSVDTAWVTFYERPEANAGLDNAICGNYYELEAFYDLTESIGYSPDGWWSTYETPDDATADIDPQDLAATDVTVSHVGVYQFVFRENNAFLPMCYDTDTVVIEFVESPVITAGEDKDVCGTETDLEGIPGSPLGNGTWLANGSAYDDYTDPQTHVAQSGYGDVTYTWLESNTATTDETFSCSSQDDVVITYWRIPTANILTDEPDSTACGYEFDRLRAENPGSGISGYWFTENPATTFDPSEFDVFVTATVPSYGYHDFYWIEETGPALNPGFCNDTAGPLTIHFIQIPDADAGIDTLFCGYTGYLDAVPSVGAGVWSTPSAANVSFEDLNDPETLITSSIINTGNPTNPYFNLIWTEDNTNGCTDKDTIKVVFARIPESLMNIIPPKCFGEPATIAAAEDSLQQYTWNFFSGAIDSTTMNDLSGEYQNFVYWNSEDTLHRISLISTNYWGCQSPITIDTVYEPAIPDFDVTLISDTCMLDRGGIVFGDTLANTSFFWIDTTIGPAVGPITTVYDLPSGDYYIRTSYLTPNTTHYAYYLSTFNSANCVDTLLYEIEPIGMIEALIEIDITTDLGELVAPEATVFFNNNSIYDDVSKRCEWHFGDETTEKNCDPQVEHIYTEAGCYEPFLIVMNRDLPECRDTAYLDACIPVDNASEIEVPNVFSPNGDGINDFFQVKAETLRTFTGIIVNRWGRTVYEWDNWSEYEAGWDGKLGGGIDATPGVYYFVIKAVGMDDQEYDLQGPLHLVRN